MTLRTVSYSSMHKHLASPLSPSLCGSTYEVCQCTHNVKYSLRNICAEYLCGIFPAEYLCGVSVWNTPCGISVRNTPCGILRAEYLCGILRAEYSCGIHNDLDLTSTLGQSRRGLFTKKVHPTTLLSEMRRVIRFRKVTARSTSLTPTRTHTRYPSPSGLLEFLSSSSAKQWETPMRRHTVSELYHKSG